MLVLGQARLHVAARLGACRCAVWREVVAAGCVGVLLLLQHAGVVRVHGRCATTRQGGGRLERVQTVTTSTVRHSKALQCAQSRGNRWCRTAVVGRQGRAVSRGARGRGLHRVEGAARRYYVVVIDAMLVRGRAVANDETSGAISQRAQGRANQKRAWVGGRGAGAGAEWSGGETDEARRGEVWKRCSVRCAMCNRRRRRCKQVQVQVRERSPEA